LTARRPSAGPVVVACGLVVTLGAGFAIGKAVARDSAAPATVPSHTHPPALPGAVTDGLTVSGGGYRLVVDRLVLTAGVAQPFTFRVVRTDGTPVTTFATVHENPLHLVVVRQDLTGFQHLHPQLRPDGTWSTSLLLPQAGTWRAVAEFTAARPAGQQTAVTLGVNLAVAGDFRPVPLPPPTTHVDVDGYTVAIEGDVRVGATQPLLVRVRAGGAPVTSLERYLGSYGHLVLVREGDLAYLHVHPDEELSGGAVRFWLGVPSAGRYRAFFEFQTAGVVHTAAFTVEVS
jgi:hypothetical protein